jgi:hypothetical protein
MPIEIREEIAGFESEDLLLHAHFVQHAAPQDAFVQMLCLLRIKVAQSPVPQANSAMAFFATVLSRPWQGAAPDQPRGLKIGSNPTPQERIASLADAVLSHRRILHQQLNHRPRCRRLPPMRRIDHRERP